MREEAPVRHRHKRHESRARQIWRRYRFELLWLLVVGLGLFLLLERFSLRETFTTWLIDAIVGLLKHFQQLDSRLTVLMTQVSPSDVVGAVLIAAAVAAILLRLRSRAISDPNLTIMRCPKCGGGIHRIHRTAVDRLVSLYVPVRRYRCESEACRWRGLRVGKHQLSARRREQPTI